MNLSIFNKVRVPPINLTLRNFQSLSSEIEQIISFFLTNISQEQQLLIRLYQGYKSSHRIN